jgi:hypothetical protein
MNILFTTLFLTLITGSFSVKVEVDAQVAQVEFRLDGHSVAVDTRAPWQQRIDFGSELAPHVLEAVAVDDEGREIGRAEQWVNLPQPDKTIEISLGGGGDGSPRSVRLITSSTTGTAATATSLLADNVEVEPEEDGSYVLPDLDPLLPHVLRASAQYADGMWAHRDLVFGGSFGGEVKTELTAVPINRRRRPKIEIIEQSYTVAGRPVRISSIDKPGHKIFVVADGNLKHWLATIPSSTSPTLFGRQSLLEKLATDRPDSKQDLFFVVRPTPERRGRGSNATDVYPVTQPLRITPAVPVDWHLTHLDVTADDPSSQHLADAVAVAGVRAAATQCPRAVLLLLSENGPDKSRFSPGEVRRFLETLRVPLVVWRWGSPPQADPWGPDVREMGNTKNLQAAIATLNGLLRQQWIVWLEGRYPIHLIEADG